MLDFLKLLDWIAFCVYALFCLYIFVFSLFSLKKGKKEYPAAAARNRFVVLFPAYKEDNVIIDSVKSFYEQAYPEDLYRIIVICDSIQEATLETLKSLGATVMLVDGEERSKAKALNFATTRLNSEDYDVVVVMDADNQVQPNFLQQLNDAYASGARAMQAHRIAKNRNTDIAYLDGISEEINNSIFRKGHVNAGLSSALSGSGMAFNFSWFKENIGRASTVGEDKELELFLLYDKIHVDYLEDVFVWDEKVQTKEVFSQQRQRWISAQAAVLAKGMRWVPEALMQANIDFLNKLFQWMIPPRLVLMGGGAILVLGIGIVSPVTACKWVCAFLLLLAGIRLAMPIGFLDPKSMHIYRHIPKLFFSLVLNIIFVKRGKKKFIHTPHGGEK
jgi:cellulose synthase/poly-beta-1,6-N-acetylglucosamine synthase-like glycosyltransferase